MGLDEGGGALFTTAAVALPESAISERQNDNPENARSVNNLAKRLPGAQRPKYMPANQQKQAK